MAAEPSDLPPIDPPNHWHVLTQDDASSDSKCIGNPVTPLCAVETIRACGVRASDELCRVGMGLADQPGLMRGPAQPATSELYRIVNAVLISRGNRKKFTFDDFRPEIGDVVIQLLDRPCSLGTCGVTMQNPTSYRVRKGAAAWHVEDWATPRRD